ncbi:MAG: tetratricopeptide repeat protein [Calditrichaceae bacterium]|nr:tetratricopeptide repeat protein [Calditrichaceae bacterium]MBN2710533.1 tetratricopeptide repeat protein [Calditrichaceae bacterium]RQV96552.1 MAG: tetratricopeptide repeat protein [Calditrichota bacterium]
MSEQTTILFARNAADLLKKESIEEALQICEMGVKQFPLYAEGHYTLARCYEKNNMTDEAAREYERVLNFIPGHLGALNALARLQHHKALYQAGNQLKLNAFFYHSHDPKLAKYLSNEGLLPKRHVGTDTIPVVEEKQLSEIPDMPEEDFSHQEYISKDKEESIVYEPETDEEFDQAIGQVIEEPLFISPELDREINKSGSDEPSEVDMLLGEYLPEKKPIQEEPEIHAAGVDNEKEPHMADDLFAEEDSVSEKAESTSQQTEEDSKIDLSRYANTRDDFSTLMNDMFDPDAEPEIDEEVEQEQEAEGVTEEVREAEERPILDTSIIFLEKKQSDYNPSETNTGADSDGEGIASYIKDDNTLAEDVAKMPSNGLKEELPVKEPASDGANRTDDLTTVIKKLESAGQKKYPANSKTISEPEVLDSTAVLNMTKSAEDDSVSIEDIMSNPSLLTPTFGEILIAQKKFDNAKLVFRELLKKDPDNTRFQKKIEFLDKLVAMNK